MKKKWIIGICILLIAVLLIPIPMRLKDGGTVRYTAILYSIEDVHRLNPDMNSDQGYLEGTIIKILGMEVYNNVEVINEEKWDLKPMVLIDGVLYLTTGKSNGDLLTSDVIDGEITSEVDGSERPTKNDQSNFGTGYYYRYGEEGTVELLHEGKWWIYEAESTE